MKTVLVPLPSESEAVATRPPERMLMFPLKLLLPLRVMRESKLPPEAWPMIRLPVPEISLVTS
jgi:hypothetical protein